MLKALWFLFKAALLVFAVMWLAARPGVVEISWQGWIVETSTSFAVILFMAVLLVWAFAYRIWRGFVSVPEALSRYRATRMREKGYHDVTRGLVAVAAGDGPAAEKFSRRALAMIPGAPLARLLTAQAAMMNGNAPRARREFAALLEDDDAAFFGIRGLLSDLLVEGNTAEALQLVRRAEKLQPRRRWVIRTLFDLETRSRDWLKAEATLSKAEKYGVFTKEDARRHRQALLMAKSDQAFAQGQMTQAIKYADKARDIDASFVPAAVRLAMLYGQAGKARAALKTVEKTWALHPHPALAELWMKAVPPARKSSSPYDTGRHIYDWMKRLYDLQPEHRDSLRAMGAAALEARMWREARNYLTRAMDYRLLARLEQAETGNEAKTREWLEMAAENPPDPKWICGGCGHASLDWAALCHRCGVFNDCQWMTSGSEVVSSPRKIAGLEGGFISPPNY